MIVIIRLLTNARNTWGLYQYFIIIVDIEDDCGVGDSGC